MIISSLALLLAAAMPVAPTSNPIHLHPRVKVQDDRIAFVLTNPTGGFRDVKIDGRTYTIGSHQTLGIKVPAGTVIFSASRSFSHRVGEVLFEVTAIQNHTNIRLD